MSHSLLDRIRSLKHVRLTRVAVALAASFVLLFGTACSPSSPSASGTGSYQQGRENPTELYRPNQPNKGGMNSYSDTDPRQDSSALSTKAKARVDQAKSNINKVQSKEELGDEIRSAKPFRAGAKDVSERASNAVEGLKDDITEGTQRGVKNLQRNTTQAKQGVQETFDDARQNAAQAGKDVSYDAKRAAGQLQGNLDNARRDVQDNIEQLSQDASYGVQRTANKVEGAAKDAQRDLSYRAQRDIDDAATYQANEYGKQATPELDAKDLIERAKDTFSTATQNTTDFIKDQARE